MIIFKDILGYVMPVLPGPMCCGPMTPLTSLPTSLYSLSFSHTGLLAVPLKARHAPLSEPLHWLFPLPEILFLGYHQLQVFVQMSLSYLVLLLPTLLKIAISNPSLPSFLSNLYKYFFLQYVPSSNINYKY